MEFNQLVFDKLGMIFQKYNLHIIEQFKNYLKLKSDSIIIAISHNVRENTNALYVGRNDSLLYPIDESILKNVFKSNLIITHVTQEIFVNNLVIFFEAEGKSLMTGNISVLQLIEKYVKQWSEAYTKQLVDKQNLEAANQAWEESNYVDFIKYLNKIDKHKLPSSYGIKYRMAHKKLK